MISRVACIARELLLSNSPYFTPFFWEEARLRRKCAATRRMGQVSFLSQGGIRMVRSSCLLEWSSQLDRRQQPPARD
jgi:hypothetical protein